MAETISHPIVATDRNEKAPNEAPVGVNRVTMSDWQGHVVFHFERKCDYLVITSEEARQLAEVVARQAYKAKFGDYPTTQNNSAIVEQRRIRAKNRVATILRTKTWKTEKGLQDLANQITDQICKQLLE